MTPTAKQNSEAWAIVKAIAKRPARMFGASQAENKTDLDEYDLIAKSSRKLLAQRRKGKK